MIYDDIKLYVIKNKGMIFIFIALIFGYQFGKDMAQRDNARDKIALEADTNMGNN